METTAETTAYHEAGHAVAAWLFGGRVGWIRLDPEEDELPRRSGETRVLWPRKLREDAVFPGRVALVALGGPVAEAIYSGDPFHPSAVREWQDDWQIAWGQAAAIVPKEAERMAWLEDQTRRVNQLFRQDSQWSAIAAVADHLLAHDEVEREDFEELVEYWLPRE